MQPSRSRFTARAVAMSATSCVLAGILGCSAVQREGGSQASKDQHTYVSYPWEPKTVSLIDTTSDEVLWTYEVPVGKKLVILFDDDGQSPLAEQQMLWGVGEPQVRVDLDNEMPVPSRHVRKLSWEIRPVPEYAEAESAGGEGG